MFEKSLIGAHCNRLHDLALSIRLGCFVPKTPALENYYYRFAFKSTWDGTIQYLEVRWCWFHHIIIQQTVLLLAEHTSWQSLEAHCLSSVSILRNFCDFLGLICLGILFDPVCHVKEPKRLEGIPIPQKHKRIWEITSR